MHKCLACQRPITWNFAICSKCETKYGKSAKHWPDWLRFLWNDTQRTRRRDTKAALYEVPFEEELDDDDF